MNIVTKFKGQYTLDLHDLTLLECCKTTYWLNIIRKLLN